MCTVFIRDHHLWKGDEGSGISWKKCQTIMQTNNSPTESSGAETTIRVVPGWAEMARSLSLTTIGQWTWVPQEEHALGQVSPRLTRQAGCGDTSVSP